MRDGRIAVCHSYYLAKDTDTTDRAPVPSRSAAARMAEEQVALRRIATLVAQGVSRDALFAAVNEAVAQLVGADLTAMMRFESDDAMTLVAHWGPVDFEVPIGARRPLDAPLRAVRDGGGPLRFGPAELPASGPFVEEAQDLGVRSSVGVPIEVDGSVWGAIFAVSTGPEPFPDDTEARMAAFTELIATALAGAQARSDLRPLLAEQAALRQVATLVARGASQPEIFDAVTEQASRLLGGQPMALLRFDPDGDAFAVAVHGGPMAHGLRVPGAGDGVAARVRRTGRPVRIDSYAAVSGPAAALAHRIGLRAAVGAPVVVAGEVWGVIEAISTDDPLPPGTEDRVAQFAELVGTAIASAESRAELTASRARVVTAADESRRRIQRDLHDGAQQRLVHTVITLKFLQAAMGDGEGPESQLVDEALRHAQQATTELRELVQGIVPAALVHGGLRAAIESHIGHVDLPVRVEITANRLPAAVEMTAYFVIAEALTNVVKHAGASSACVRAVDEEGGLLVEVRDDGAGGADPARGTGLVGLTDRVAASGGALSITSPPGMGTTLTVTLPTHGEPASGQRAAQLSLA